MEILDKLRWRYATKKFSRQKLKLDILDQLLEAANLSATSYGLQAYKILVIDDPEIREKLLPHAKDQKQIIDASHLLVLCRYNDITQSDIQEYAERIGKAKNKTPEEILSYTKRIHDKIEIYRDKGELDQWLTKQVYIILGTLLTTCAMMGIDSCPMEGFTPDAFDDILGLDQHRLKSVVLLPVGHRAEDDAYQFRPKVRKSLEDLLIFV